jgi:hypothetical protein
MWHRRGSRQAIRVVTMVLVRAVTPVRGVVHGQTANRFGWRGRNPSPTAGHVDLEAWAFGGRG